MRIIWNILEMVETILFEDFEAVDSLDNLTLFGKGTGWAVERTTDRPISGIASCMLITPAQKYMMASVNNAQWADPHPVTFEVRGAELDFLLDEKPLTFEVAIEILSGTEFHQCSIRWVQDEYFPNGMWQYWDVTWKNLVEMPLERGVKHHLKLVVDHKNDRYGYLTIDGTTIDMRHLPFNRKAQTGTPNVWTSVLLWTHVDERSTAIIDNLLFTKGESVTPISPLELLTRAALSAATGVGLILLLL